MQRLLLDLPSLTAPELKEVKSRVDFLIGVAQPKPEGDDWLLAGFAAELKRRRLSSTGTPRDITSKVRATSVEIRRTLLECSRRDLTTPEKYALGAVVAKALADFIPSGVNISMRTLINNIENVPQAVDRSFPGYLQSGMIGFLVRTKG